MQSFSFNVNDNEPVCDELIKSLSEDDEEVNEKEFYDIDCGIPPKSNLSELPSQIQNDDGKQQEMEDTEDTEEEEEEEVDYDEALVLDRDIEIAKMLNKNGYRNVTKLCCTDQGSVWRAKASNKFDFKSVVIKIASKIYYKDNRGIKGDEIKSSSEHENILNEIKLLKQINQKQKLCDCDIVKNSIIQIIDTMEDEENYIVVLEDGGIDLFNFINQCHKHIANGKITIKEWQKTVKLIGQRLMKLIAFLHLEMNVCHLDISLENVLISNIHWISYPDQYKNYKKKLSDKFQLKLIDFGAAQQFDGNMSFNTNSIIGKPMYCSPQIYKLQNKASDQLYDARSADLWSFAVAFFIMIMGCPPWTHPDEQSNKLFQTIVIENNLDFVLKAWKRSNFIDESMKDLLQKILIINEKERISTQDILKHSCLCLQ